MDLVYANIQGKSKAFINTPNGNNYLKVKLPNATTSLGAVVRVYTDSGKILTNHFITSEGLASDGSHILYFGLGKDVPEKVEVTWLNGEMEVIEDFEVNSILNFKNQSSNKR